MEADARGAGIWTAPTPKTVPAHLTRRQKRKCNALVRQNVRKLDRDIQQLKATEQKTKTLIMQSSKRAQRNPSMAKQANQDVRIFAR
jgi:hypothetical protein